MYDVERITIEIISAIACFILVKYMTKPYRLTGETRYLGLPLGFGVLGATYAFSALSFSPLFDLANFGLIQLFLRAFAFLFLAATYYFSKSDKPNFLWNITLGALSTILTVLILLAITSPQFPWPDYHLTQTYVRIFNLICLSYISIHGLRSHIQQPDPTTLMIPLGYILVGINQYSLLIWAVDSSIFAFFSGLAFRLGGLAVFLFVSYRTFHSSEKRENK